MARTRPVAISLVRFEMDFWLWMLVLLICSP